MNQFESFERYKPLILGVLEESLQQLLAQGFLVGESARLLQTLVEYTSRGKNIRGGLVVHCWLLATGRDPGEPGDPVPDVPATVLRLAAAMELLQSFLLIHDDVMDRDDERRGKPAMHVLLGQAFERPLWKGTDTGHLGNALAICAGDIAQFWTLRLFRLAIAGSAVEGRLTGLLNDELLRVGLAQFHDVLWSAETAVPEHSQILELYENKTGRYTFALPILAACTLAGLSEDRLAVLSRVANLAGQIFQIRDDEINLWGDPVKTGKPAGSDLREGKKTLALSLLAAELSGQAGHAARSLSPGSGPGATTGTDTDAGASFGAADAANGSSAAGDSKGQIDLRELPTEKLYQLLEDCGVRAKLEAIRSQLVEEARAALREFTDLEPGAGEHGGQAGELSAKFSAGDQGAASANNVSRAGYSFGAGNASGKPADYHGAGDTTGADTGSPADLSSGAENASGKPVNSVTGATGFLSNSQANNLQKPLAEFLSFLVIYCSAREF